MQDESENAWSLLSPARVQPEFVFESKLSLRINRLRPGENMPGSKSMGKLNYCRLSVKSSNLNGPNSWNLRKYMI